MVAHMTRSQLEIDLDRRCKERTHQLVSDLFELYDMVGLNEWAAAEGILTAFFMETANLAASTKVDPREAAETMGNLVTAIRQKHHASRQT
jgi:hypothetical protein